MDDDPQTLLENIYRLAGNNLRAFAATFLAHHLRLPEEEMIAARKFGWDLRPGWGDPQVKLADTLTDFVLRRGDMADKNTCVVEMFRGAGKSTIGVLALILWLSCTKRKQNIVLISDTKTQAVDHLASVIDELEQNELIRSRYGTLYDDDRESRTERKRQDDITLSNGIRIFARGAGQRMRGAKWKAIRPDCVILDDPQGEAHAESVAVMAKLTRWYDRVIIPMGSANCLFMVVATPLRHDDIITHVAKKAAVHHVRYPGAVDGVPTDPFRFPVARLRHLEETMGPTAFAQEILLKPQGDSQKAFERGWCRSWPETPRQEDGPGFIGWDPAAKAKETSDYAGIVCGRAVDGKLVVFRAINQRLRIEIQAETVVMLCVKYGIRYICVETIAAQEWALEFLKQQLKKYNWSATIVQQEHHNDKRIFVESTLQPPVFRGEIRFVPNKETDMLLNQLCNFPLDAHDDLCDALADCYLAYHSAAKRIGHNKDLDRLAKYIAGTVPVSWGSRAGVKK